jgi:hypothetical protein
MGAKEHSTVREGLIVGLLGATILAAWYFVFDAAAGKPFHTPNLLGTVFFRGDLEPGVRQIVPRVVAGYTVLHLVIFALAGIGLTLLVHLTARNLALRMGLWMGLVVAFAFFAGLTYMLTTATGLVSGRRQPARGGGDGLVSLAAPPAPGERRPTGRRGEDPATRTRSPARLRAHRLALRRHCLQCHR